LQRLPANDSLAKDYKDSMINRSKVEFLAFRSRVNELATSITKELATVTAMSIAINKRIQEANDEIRDFNIKVSSVCHCFRYSTSCWCVAFAWCTHVSNLYCYYYCFSVSVCLATLPRLYTLILLPNHVAVPTPTHQQNLTTHRHPQMLNDNRSVYAELVCDTTVVPTEAINKALIEENLAALQVTQSLNNSIRT
jgi:hypothetical protein